MNRSNILFWALIVSFVFSISLGWPVWLRCITIALSCGVLVQVAVRLFKAFRKEA